MRFPRLPSVVLLTASILLASFAAAAAPPPALHDRFGPRAYVSGGQRVAVSARGDMIALRADPARPAAEIARLVEDALVKLDPALGVPGVVSARRLRAQGLFTAELAAGVSRETMTALAAVLASTPGVAAVYPVLSRATGFAFADDRLVVTAAPGRLDDVLQKVLAATGGSLVRKSRVADTALITVGDVFARDAVEASMRLGALEGLVSAEPDLYRELVPQATVDDPRHGLQWHLARPDADDPVPGAGQIFAHAAWDVTKGDPSVVVAVFDTGIDVGHEDLAQNVVAMFDAAGGDEDPRPECSYSPDGRDVAAGCPQDRPYLESHGTAVSGTIAARGDNGLGLAGVCPQCSLMAVRLLGEDAEASLSTSEAFIRAVDEGADIINNSWGPGASIYFPLSQSERDAFDHARTTGRGGKGTIIVFAAGNSTANIATDPYSSNPHVVGVAASTNLDDWAYYSNYGNEVDVAAPSMGGAVNEDDFGIHTTDVPGVDGYSEDGYATGFGGTSAASPVAAGVLGLVLSVNPELTAEQARLVLTRTADKIRADQVDWINVIGEDLATIFDYDENGHSIGFGYGRINAAAAVLTAADPGLEGALCSTVGCTICSTENRCLLPCAAQDECADGSVCENGACQLPASSPTDIGAPCNPGCEDCVFAIDSHLEPTSICTASCRADEECPGGFACRIIAADGSGVCAVAGGDIGAVAGTFNCRSPIIGGSLVVEDDEGDRMCTDVCFTADESACPYGFSCGAADCECSRQTDFGCIELECTGNGGEVSADGSSVCLPDTGFDVTCKGDLDCAQDNYCAPDGRCRFDDREGCGICGSCESDGDCSAGLNCIGARGGDGRCTRPCVDDGDCPGDSVCREQETRFGDFLYCLAPNDDPEVRCTESYTCEVPCRDDVPCGAGEVCDDGACVPEPEESDAGPVDGGAGSGGGVDFGGGCGCRTTTPDPTFAALGALLAAGAWRRRRQSMP